MLRVPDEQQSIPAPMAMMLLPVPIPLALPLALALLLLLPLLSFPLLPPPLLALSLLPLPLAIHLPLLLAHALLPLAYAVLVLAGARVDLLDRLEALHLVGHARDDELLAEQAPLAARALAHGVGEVLVVPLAVRLLDVGEVAPVPVEAHEAADQQLAAQAVLLGRRQRVVEEQRVAHRLVDDAVEDVRQQFALYSIKLDYQY